MSFKPVTLTSPRGNEYVAGSAIEVNNLLTKGYKLKTPTTASSAVVESKSVTK